MNLLDLPNEMLIYSFKFIDSKKSVENLSCVNKRINEICNYVKDSPDYEQVTDYIPKRRIINGIINSKCSDTNYKLIIAYNLSKECEHPFDKNLKYTYNSTVYINKDEEIPSDFNNKFEVVLYDYSYIENNIYSFYTFDKDEMNIFYKEKPFLLDLKFMYQNNNYYSLPEILNTWFSIF